MIKLYGMLEDKFYRGKNCGAVAGNWELGVGV